mmetsp:Transcript_32702/g.90283  ORF Transcript_32702/g.90283 Transcript_32702/m.90283 type:complete len:254 (-) Transcript_32702:1746-2507(-)
MLSSSLSMIVPEPSTSALAKASSTLAGMDCEVSPDWCLVGLPRRASAAVAIVDPQEPVDLVGNISRGVASSSCIPASRCISFIRRSVAVSSVSLDTMVLSPISETMDGGSACVRLVVLMVAWSRTTASEMQSCSSSTSRTDASRSGSPSPAPCRRAFAASLSRHSLSCEAACSVARTTSCCWRHTSVKASCRRWLAAACDCQMSMHRGHVTQRKPWQTRTFDWSDSWPGCGDASKVTLAKSANGRPWHSACMS